MSRRMTDDERMEARDRARGRAEAKQCDRIDAHLDRLEAADARIGELCREGKQVLYVYTAGGRYREGARRDLREFLVRNNYA